MDDGSPVDVIYLDFQKAFGKVPHPRLIRKLKSHGIGNSIFQKNHNHIYSTHVVVVQTKYDRTV